MRVYSAAIAIAALGVATAQTATTTSTTTTTVSTSSGSGDSISASAGGVSCVFRYSMPTATNLPSGLSTSTSQTSSGSQTSTQLDGSSDLSGSVGDGSGDNPGTVGVGSDSSSASSASSSSSATTSADSSSSSSGSSTTPTSTTKTPATTTKTPTSTTKTPTSTTKTPTSTTKTPTSTTKTPTSTSTPSTSTSSGSSNSATTSPSTSTTDGSGGRRLMGEAGDATTVSTTIGTTGTTATVSADASGSTGTSTSTSQTTAPTSTTATPSSTTKTPSSTTKSPTSTTSTPTSTTAPTTSTTTGSFSSTTGSAGVVGSTSGSTTIEFSCDSTFYSAWTKMGLTCEGTELDVQSAAASTECLIYSGTSSGTAISDLSTCMSVCRFPACNNGTWDYSATDGINSDVYAGLDFITLMQYAGSETTQAVADAVEQPFSNLTFAAATECEYASDNSFSACQCAGVSTTASSSSSAGTTASSSNAAYAVPADKGLEDSNHWADGSSKTTVDKAGIASTTIGSSAATVSVVAGGVMSVASGVVGGTSAGVASGVSAAASVGITMAAVDICQFSIMLNQMNVDARPRFMENMGKKMAPAAFNFLPFGKSNSSSSDDSNSSGSTSSSGSYASRRLTTGSSTSGSSSSGSGSSSTTTGVQGMEKYASLIGVDPDMLFYLAVAGIGCMVAIVFGAYAIVMGVCYFIVEDFPTFSRKWLDKAIGVLMMILILSEYVVGATAMYQICYCIDNDSVDVSFFLAIITLLGLAFGTILYGVLVIKNNEDELRDLGTKDHFDKKFHNRYGPLYDEHSFEGRFFFAPKLLLALLCGMTTGMVWIQGLWQIIVLIAFHIAFLLYLEIKQPYPTAFVQKTSSFVIIIKISALFLSFFLLSSATSFTESIPDDLREGVAFAIVGLQVLVLVCLMIRQVYIFYRTWKLKRDGVSDDDKTVTVQTTNAREGSEAFFALGGEPQYYGNNNQSRGNSLAVLGDDSTPRMQDPRQYAQETPANYNQGNRLRGLQPQAGHGMTRTHTVVQHEGHHRNNEVDL
uniref:TRP C-terminal domain-containing protein n=1 Tax=Phytophthora ramorum TaxID=164328 RepID=H3GDQ3_PHYRM